jgi:predicted alpha/beta superfamily hydrolase
MIMRWIIYLLVFCSLNLEAQLTFNITSVPANTPSEDMIYFVGDFNSWNPGDANSVLHNMGASGYFLTLNIPSGTINYKFTRGSWQTVEGNQTGGFIENRSSTFSAGDTIQIQILSWEDLGGNSSSTALSSVSVLSSNFFMPELNRNRKIWVCLPTDYNTALNKNYRVVYMHDGQNLFDVANSFAGEWGIDEHMRDLFNQGDPSAIIVGIENGPERIDEYCPWFNPTYGGGEGDEYVDFIKSTLKPYVDSVYRTLPQASETAIAGSSLGGLISLYAAAKYPETFGKAGVFSPAFWINSEPLNTWLQTIDLPQDLRVYMVGGTSESSTMISNMNQVRQNLLNAGVSDTNIIVNSVSDGAHSEWFWNREFPEAYIWLFRNNVVNTNVNQVFKDEQAFTIYPNPSNSKLSLEVTFQVDATYAIFDLSGKELMRDTISSRLTEINIESLAAGKYVISLTSKQGKTYSRHFVKAKN